ncbi:carbohydrate ABC transporter permease [Paenibacillus eucommiae]|uniref:Multiple sugar transport system permease protein n=1 Tax=Paenibacillus eucommiae TaxID=1355755 RepID=A0ABS4IT64_9BACL|nr:carbohydrate ABC transporter permease [Paenibacillus eucommiae]MBP1990767.1 multiple sugar transport system permease protein [Paenibacillus eucommiae]
MEPLNGWGKKGYNDLTWRKGLRSTRYFILGKEADKGLIFRVFIYLILIDTAYIYLNPIFYMIASMVKNATDLIDPAVYWVPRVIYTGVLQEAWEMLQYPKALMLSTGLSLSVALLQTISCAVAGYAFARLEFPFKRFWMFCLLLSFIVPVQVLILPNLLVASQLKLIPSYLPIILPALFGHGLKGALFVIIYRQFFSTQPKELEEAAKIDGASVFRIFFKVMLPLAKPAILVVFLFSFVWTWNDYYLPSMYLIGSQDVPLSMGISQIALQLNQKAAEVGPSIFDEPLKMATSFLIILPPLLLYGFAQRWFVESVERTGIVE